MVDTSTTNQDMTGLQTNLLNSQGNGLDWDAYRQKLADLSKSAGTVAGADSNGGVPSGLGGLYGQASKMGKTTQYGAQSVLESYKAQQQGMQTAAKQSQLGLEMGGALTEIQLRQLEEYRNSINGNLGQVSGYWADAMQQADDYAKAALQKVSDVTSKVEGIFREWQQDRTSAKANAMQAGVQAVAGTMQEQEKNIAQTYGVNSPEYASFQGAKVKTLGSLFSNIQTQFQQMSETAFGNYMQTMAGSLQQMNMYASYQEQQHVETIRMAAQADDAMKLQQTQLGLATIAAEGTVYQNFMDLLNNMPTYVMDTTASASAIMDLIQAEQENKQAQEALRTANSVPSYQIGKGTSTSAKLGF